MDRQAQNLQVRLVNGVPGFTVHYASGSDEHFCFSSIDTAETFYQAFGAVLREAKYTQHSPGERLTVGEHVSLCIQPPKEDQS